MLIGIVGICLIAFSAGAYFISLAAGSCLACGLLGLGLLIDACQKSKRGKS